jgi:integrase
MSIKKIDDTTFKIDARIKIKSKTYRKRETFSGGLKAAKRRELEILEELRNEAAKQSGSLKIKTFGDVLEFYKKNHDLKRSLCLVDRLNRDLGCVVIQDLADPFYEWMLAVKTEYAPASMNRYIAWAKAALNYAIGCRLYIGSNPLAHDLRFKRLKEYPRKQRLNDSQKEKLLKVVKIHAPHIFYIVQYALLIPGRKEELITMRREWYDMINNYIIIPGDITKNKDPVVKPVPEELTEYMRSIPVESEFIFYRKRGNRYVSLGDFKRSWKKCLQLAGISDFRFHDSRRTAYTDLILDGDHPKVVQKLSGHRTDMSNVYLAIEGIEAVQAYQKRRANKKVDTNVDTFTGIQQEKVG